MLTCYLFSSDFLHLADPNLEFLVIVLHVMANECLPVKSSVRASLPKIWLSYALQDATLFLATLSFGAIHLDIIARRYTSIRTLAYKAEVIKSINARLQTSDEMVSNTTIGAVAMLTALEVSSPNTYGFLLDCQLRLDAQVGFRVSVGTTKSCESI